MKTDEIIKLTREAVAEIIRVRAQGDSYTGPERRQCPRWPFPGTVEIYPQGPDSGQRWFATCRNISETGLGMSAERYFDPETVLEVAIHLPEATLCGQAVVRYCMQTPRGFMTGIEFLFDS